MRRPVLTTFAVLCVALAGCPRAAHGQGALPALGGIAGGAVAGSAVTAGWLALQAAGGNLLWRPDELVGPALIPPVLGAVGGGIQGATDQERLWSSMGYGAVAGVVGAGAGYLLGAALGDTSRARWQGFLMGGALGVVAGWAAGALLYDDEEGADAAPALVIRIPLNLRSGLFVGAGSL